VPIESSPALGRCSGATREAMPFFGAELAAFSFRGHQPLGRGEQRFNEQEAVTESVASRPTGYKKKHRAGDADVSQRHIEIEILPIPHP
jgi:hypothetical protein